jgi:hypothetical protein
MGLMHTVHEVMVAHLMIIRGKQPGQVRSFLCTGHGSVGIILISPEGLQILLNLHTSRSMMMAARQVVTRHHDACLVNNKPPTV